MTAILCPHILSAFLKPEKNEIFFDSNERDRLKELYLPREYPKPGIPSQCCIRNLFFGFFFDGTKNNYELAESTNEHSNVARLYDAYPGQSVPGVLPKSTDWKDEQNYKNFFRVYVPGVASPFKQIGDTGVASEQTFGASAGRQGNGRIVWALIQAINNVHRYFLQSDLIGQDEIDSCVESIVLTKRSRAMMGGGTVLAHELFLTRYNTPLEMKAAQAFGTMLVRLQKALVLHRPNDRTGRVPKVEPAIIKTIYISVFGFSRGASEARVFLNWFRSLCELDAKIGGRGSGTTLAGFRVEFDFLGLFDTVASVGLANTTGHFQGHGAWADTEDSLRVPSDVHCLHIVAAHEPRRSFPVDSVSVNGVLPDRCREIIFPGAHSDVGGGYGPCEQGRGERPDGNDMLSRIPLVLMYKAARLCGAPLKLELTSDKTKKKFAVEPETIEACNAYLATCKLKSGRIHDLMRENMRKMIEWRVFRRLDEDYSIERTGSFKRATNFFKNDLHGAAKEFVDELQDFSAWLRGKGGGFRPSLQASGFRNGHEGEWEEIATWWGQRQDLEPAIQRFFDDYVHDSRASFKLGSIDNEAAMHKHLRQLVTLSKQNTPVLIGKSDFKSTRALLTSDERQAASEYEKTGKIPRMYMGGREPWKISFGVHIRAGYLRFRRVYGGSDSEFLS